MSDDLEQCAACEKEVKYDDLCGDNEGYCHECYGTVLGRKIDNEVPRPLVESMLAVVQHYLMVRENVSEHENQPADVAANPDRPGETMGGDPKVDQLARKIAEELDLRFDQWARFPTGRERPRAQRAAAIAAEVAHQHYEPQIEELEFQLGQQRAAWDSEIEVINESVKGSQADRRVETRLLADRSRRLQSLIEGQKGIGALWKKRAETAETRIERLEGMLRQIADTCAHGDDNSETLTWNEHLHGEPGEPAAPTHKYCGPCVARGVLADQLTGETTNT